MTLKAEAAEVVDSIASEEEEKTGSKPKEVVEGIVDLPKTGGNAICYYITGAAILLLGAVVTILRKKIK